MRRSDREITDFSEIVDVLNRCDTIHLGIHGNDYPYVVPLSFGYEIIDGKLVLYIHGAKVGIKHELLAQNNHVCVEGSVFHRFVPVEDSATTEYESIIGFGIAETIVDDEAIHGLELIMDHCGMGHIVFDRRVASVTLVYKITLESITGKRLFMK